MRTTTYRDRTVVIGSTPVFDSGPVCQSYEKSDKRVWEVPCPSCGEFAELRWPDMRWEPGDASSTHWVCPSNGCVVTEEYQPSMIAAGHWRATAPEVVGHAGFRISALASPHPNQRWSALVAEWLEKCRSPETAQTFKNTVLGEPWSIADGEGLDEEGLAARREPFGIADIPPAVLVLTAGIDCQNDRLELVLIGHGRTEMFVLDHTIFYGPIDGDTVWSELDDYLRQSWPHPLGGTIRVDAAMVDSGSGGHTEIVHGFCRPRANRRIFSCKGDGGMKRPIAEQSKNQTHLWIVGVDAVKSRLFDRLSRPDGGGIRFSHDLQPVYFEQLTSETLVVRRPSGIPTPRFERIRGKRAETLDATVYAWAARALINVNLDQREALLSSPVVPVADRRREYAPTVGRMRLAAKGPGRW